MHRWFCLVCGIVALLLTGCGDGVASDREDERIAIQYWEKWSGFEAQAMADLVARFNREQDAIRVEFLSVSQIDRKLMLATAGGNPPDVCGMWANEIPALAENGALTPLDGLMARAGLDPDRYLDAVRRNMTYRGRTWGLPTTPAASALHINTQLVRAAGLDPDQPPATIAELEAWNEQLTRRGPDGRLQTLGHLPTEPGWWRDSFPLAFGATFWSEAAGMTLQTAEMQRAFGWLASYPERFGAEALRSWSDVGGQFASPQNPFFQGRVAMVMQGPWMHNFISKFASPDFEYTVAPFPAAADSGLPFLTLVGLDVLVIPRGAKHPQAAFTFMRWVNEQRNMEALNRAHFKFSPLKATTPGFYPNHPNPHIATFAELAAHPQAEVEARLPSYRAFRNDMHQAVDQVLFGDATVAEALSMVQRRQSRRFDRGRDRWEQVGPTRMATWDRVEQQVLENP